MKQPFPLSRPIKKQFVPALLIVFLLTVLFSSCKEIKQPPQFMSKDISNITARMTDIMVHDITNPPLAARFFSYACLAGYEIVSQNDTA